MNVGNPDFDKVSSVADEGYLLSDKASKRWSDLYHSLRYAGGFSPDDIKELRLLLQDQLQQLIELEGEIDKLPEAKNE